ncbi:MAG: hypothetical protein M1486_00425, partial [Gammaproteobacteria bacterium]|nr:hypothetical protein [Gammaproteobacteria bacterium]
MRSTAVHYFLNASDWENGWASRDRLLANVASIASNQAHGEPHFGFKLDGKWFDGINEASVYSINKIFIENKSRELSSDELNLKIEEAIDKIYTAVERKYHSQVAYENHNTLPLDALYAATQEAAYIQVPNRGR